MRAWLAVVCLLLATLTASDHATKPARPLDRGREGATYVAPFAPDSHDGAVRRPVRASRARRTTPQPGDPLLVPFPPLTGRHLTELRNCENGGRYTSDPEDPYRGAYQALPDTWRRLWLLLRRPRYAALDPARASRRVQDAFARHLHRIAGRGQWPVCSRVAGLP